MVEALTDNRNRTGSEIRHAFERHGGSLGEPGSVAWQFEKRGVVLVDGERYGEDDLMPAIDAGAEDVSEDGDLLKITTAASDLTAVRAALEEVGVEVQSAELSMEPKNTVEVEEGEARALLRLMDALEEHDDVDSVHANFDVPEEILERAAAAG
jgi:YebC/PmpR family DNA-binding regulatory protein